MSGLIKTGISAWTEKTLVESGWYPPGARTAEGRLRYYATQFPIVENDGTYYALPSAEQAALWRDRTPEGFTMNVKAFAALTGHYIDPRRLPRDLREALPEAARGKARVYPRDLGGEVLREIRRRFAGALGPLRESGRLGLVLFQYPVWTPISREHMEQIARVRWMLPEDRIAVEFRNATWMSERNRAETLAFLRDHELVYTCVDEPQGFVSSVPPIAAATSDVALVRFHGRKAEAWEKAAESARERFAYRYAAGELREWVPRLLGLAEEAREVHVIMNNCYSNYAASNAAELAAMLLDIRGAAVRAAS
ncbi:MAG: DUF72 domain-containing protein [Polyangiaceae bacterium]|nr:DUF72 domain-containing protein [Polyangiaceae bacterium]